MTEIVELIGRRVWDSRGNPTVEAEVKLAGGATGRAIAPAGASRGRREALDLRDGGDRLRGLDVSRALVNINGRIAKCLAGCDATDQRAIDNALLSLDDSPLKSQLGGNASVATSLAVLHAAAAAAGKSLWRHVADQYNCEPILPLPEIQIFGGGAHAGRCTDIQDFMIMVPGAESFDEVMEITSNIYFAAGELMAATGRLAGVADEGGWWPQFDSNEQALETLVSAIEKAGETPGERVVISLDVAASEFGRAGRYRLALDGCELDSSGMIDLLAGWLDSYPIASIEDPLAEDDVDGMREFTRRFGEHLQIIGDDFLVTNARLVDAAIKQGACNAVLIKLNQAGTVSETIDAFMRAGSAGWGRIVSARSGETEDVSISHLAIGLGAGQLKVGSFSRSDRMAKWNECLRIQEHIGPDRFARGTPLAATGWGAARAETLCRKSSL